MIYIPPKSYSIHSPIFHCHQKRVPLWPIPCNVADECRWGKMSFSPNDPPGQGFRLWGSYGFQEQRHVIEVEPLSAITTQMNVICAEERTSENSTFSQDSGSKPCALYTLLRFSHVQFEILNFRMHHFYPLVSSRIITLVFQKPSCTYQIRRCVEHLETLLKRWLEVQTLPSKERLKDYREVLSVLLCGFPHPPFPSLHTRVINLPGSRNKNKCRVILKDFPWIIVQNKLYKVWVGVIP